MKKTYSMEKQITVRTAVSSILVFFVASLILDVLIVEWIKKEYDNNLTTKAQVIATLIKDLKKGLEFDFADEIMPEFERSHDSEFFQIWQQDNGVFERSHSVQRNGDLQPSSSWKKGVYFKNIKLPDNREGRQIEVVLTPQIVDKQRRTAEIINNQKKVRLIIAKERESIQELIFIIHLALSSGCLFVGVIIVLQMSIIIRSSLSPLTLLRQQISQLDPKRIKQRIEIENSPLELTSVVDQFNEALSKIEESSGREQRFTADVAHELRTPISELKSMAEVAIRWKDEDGNSEQFNQDVYDIALQMQTTTSNLLALARSDKGTVALEPTEQNIYRILQRVAERNISLAKNRQIQIEYKIDDKETLVITSKTELELVLSNIINNAIEYADPGSVVTIEQRTVDTNYMLIVTNETSSLEQQDLNLMFDRMWRKDTARSGSSHSGLGMALIKSYAELLSLEIDVILNKSGAFSLRLSGFAAIEK